MGFSAKQVLANPKDYSFEFSDRFVGLMAGTAQKKGNDPHTVCEAIRKYGLIPEEMLPFSDDLQSYDEYYSFKGADEEACRRAGREWLAQYDFLHEWVYAPTQSDDEKNNNLKVALKYSPIPFSVYAWATDARGVFVGLALQNHLTCCTAYPDEFKRVFDSYDPFNKSVDQVPLYAKRIYVEKKESITETQKKSLWELIKAFLFGYPEEVKKLEPILNSPIMPPNAQKSPVERLIEAVRESIGKDASPANIADKEVGCAESMSNLIHKVFQEFPAGIISTTNLFKELRKSALFKGVLEPKAGCVVISPRTEITNGHVGCFITDTRIVSNDSETGLMKDNYSWQNWINEFKDKRGLRIYLFQLK